MSQQPVHLSEEALILHYYGETPDPAIVEAHLAGCAACRDELARLAQLLSVVEHAGFDAASVPEPGPAFEREVWARLAPQLEAHRQSWWSRLLQGTPKWALAGGVAALVLAAFAAGRFTTSVPAPAPADTADTGVAERVLVVAVVDHLDRSQMVLVELLNADVEDAVDLASEQSRARDLVAANRLYRQTAVQTGDERTSAVLDELERVLLEIANTPQDASRADLDALRARIVSAGVLFKVRVVHSEMLERERRTFVPGSQS